MSLKDLNISINPINGPISPPYSGKKSKSLVSYLDKIFDNDITKKRKSFTGIVLRVEKLEMSSTDKIDTFYQPGSFPYRRYAGKLTKPPNFHAAKVYIPEVHSMLPVPRFSADYSNHIYDLLPTFYTQSLSVGEARLGSYVKVTFGDLENLEDPIYLGPDFGGENYI